MINVGGKSSKYINETIIVGTPGIYGAKGDGVSNDTTAIQQALTNFDIVDLKGKSYVCGALTLKSNQTLKNGKLICNNVSTILYGNNTNNVTIQNLEINGSSTSEKAIFIWTGNNILIDNCNIHDMRTISDQTSGVHLKLCTLSKVTRCTFTNIVGVPNSVIGDALGSSRAVVFERCTNSIIDLCNIYNISSTDDGDGIHLIDAEAGYSPTEIETDSFNVISNCKIGNCTRSSIKIQQSGVLVFHNDLTSDANQIAFMDYGIRVYGSNITIKDNRIECYTSTPVMIGNSLNTIIKNIIIQNNYVKYDGTAFQACVVMNTSPVIENVLIDGNNFIPTSATSEQGVYIRTYAKNVRVVNNKMINVKNAVYVRDISGITAVSGSVREKLIVSNNDCEVVNNLLYEEATNIYDGLVVTSNHINITSPLSFAQNSVRLSDAQLNNNSIIANNRIKNSGFDDGVKNNGATSIRPTAGRVVGFKYFDTTLGKPIWWNGSAWKDATGTTV